jgi:tRNA pseudouridine38-40 synthase
VHNIKLTLAYDGTDFHGWQIQPGRPTIQGALGDVVRKLTGERLTVFGAGRTDAGVHALGQVAHFKTHSELTAAEFQRAFNALLPATIRVVAAEELGPDFHARWQALAKTYCYRLWRGRVVPPLMARGVLHYPWPLDEAAMERAAPLFEGVHDFSSFAASAGSEDDDRERTMTREIFSARVFRGTSAALEAAGVEALARMGAWGGEAELLVAIRGKSFLRYMVRKLVGTLIDVGKGKLAPEDMPRLFELRDRSKAGATVPPGGLFLVSVEYPEPWKLR